MATANQQQKKGQSSGQGSSKIDPAAYSKFQKEFVVSRLRGVPIVCAETLDPAATIRNVKNIFEDNEVPILSWNICGGVEALNDKGADKLQQMLLNFIDPETKEPPNPAALTNPSEMLTMFSEIAPDTIFFIHNAHRYIGMDDTSQASVGQAIWNLRDKFKKNGRTLVLLSPPPAILPNELIQDVMVLEDALPTPPELERIVQKMHTLAKLEMPAPAILTRSTELVRGMSAFAAEQNLAVAMTEKGLDMATLFERQRKTIELVPGLSVYKGKETFNDVLGIPIIKAFLKKLFSGRNAPTLPIFLDEIEKMFAGIKGDTSGTSQQQHQEFLRAMQNWEWLGILLVGHPGCSKSYLVKAVAGEFGLPMIEMNVGAMQDKYVGESGAQTRLALTTCNSMGRPIVFATSNDLDRLPSELKRRFQLGTWFFDLPNNEEQQQVANYYIKKYGLSGVFPSVPGWTQAEIKTCCDLAWRLDVSPMEAMDYVVPICKSDPSRIKELQQRAHMRFNSASYAGPYKFKPISVVEEAERAIKIGSVGEA